jgi:hypothetical protein
MEIMSTFEANKESVEALNELLQKIPEHHRGILFERVLAGFAPNTKTAALERGLAETWAKMNDIENAPLLERLLFRNDVEDFGQMDSAPQNNREWEIAYLVAATIIQWLGTPVGCAFLKEAFEKGGAQLEFKFKEKNK